MAGFLGRGEVECAIAQFNDRQHERGSAFIAYLNKHRQRIVNDGDYQAEEISIGSGTIESTLKQIGRWLKLIRGTMEKRECAPSAQAALCLPECISLKASLARLASGLQNWDALTPKQIS